jgi:hypothetical protein
MGGAVPFGYRVENRALHIVEEHAEFVRDLFKRYLKLGSVVRLKTVLDAENVRLPVRIAGTGRAAGGGLISRGQIYWILSNPIYVGRLRHKGRSTTVCIVRSSTLRRGIASNVGLRSKRKRGRVPIAIPNPFLLASSTTIAATGWAQAMPPKAGSVGATTSRGLCSKVATQTPDPSRASRRRKSRNRCSTRSKGSSHPNVRTRVSALCRFLVFPGGRSARPGNHAKRYQAMRTCSTRSSESRLARSRSRSGSANPLPSMAQVEH